MNSRTILVESFQILVADNILAKHAGIPGLIANMPVGESDSFATTTCAGRVDTIFGLCYGPLVLDTPGE